MSLSEFSPVAIRSVMFFIINLFRTATRLVDCRPALFFVVCFMSSSNVGLAPTFDLYQIFLKTIHNTKTVKLNLAGRYCIRRAFLNSTTYLDFRLTPIILFIILPSNDDALRLNTDRHMQSNKFLNIGRDALWVL